VDAKILSVENLRSRKNPKKSASGLRKIAWFFCLADCGCGNLFSNWVQPWSGPTYSLFWW